MTVSRFPNITLKGLLFIILVSISCNLPTVQKPGYYDLIPVSTQALENLQSEIQKTIQNAQNTGEFTLTISEEEITSLASFELEKLPDRTIQEPQIYLRDGVIQVAAKLIQGNLQTPLQLFISVEPDTNGYPVYHILSGTLGPLPMPDLLREQIKNQLDHILSERIYSQGSQIIIQGIHISDGLMTIKGRTP